MSYWGNRQPPPYTQINWSDPISRGLLCALLPDGTGHMNDAIRVRTSSPVDLTPSFSGGSRGTSLGGWRIANSLIKADLSFTAGSYSVIAFSNVRTVPASAAAVGVLGNLFFVDNTHNGGWELTLCSATTGYAFRTWHNDIPSLAAAIISGGTVATGNHLIIGRFNPGVLRNLWVDGAQVATSATAVLNIATTSSMYCDANITGQSIYTGLIYNRFLSDSEATLISNEPYAVWAPPSLNITTFLMHSVASANFLKISLDGLRDKSNFSGF